jgi:hypothetical protein
VAEHSYEIVIKVGKGTLSKGAETSDDAKEKSVADIASATAEASTLIAFKSAKNIADQTVSFVTSNVGLTTGNTEAQQRIEFGMNTAQQIGAVGASLAAGNYLAAALVIINKLTSIAFRQSQIDLEQSIESESLAVSRQRFGIAFNRSRLGGAS